MTDRRDSAIEALLAGRGYEWAVANGHIQSGQSLSTAEALGITQRDVVAYLEAYPVPGLDTRVADYQNVSDGPKWCRENGGFVVGWQERGAFFPEHAVSSEEELRQVWIKYLAGSLGLAA